MIDLDYIKRSLDKKAKENKAFGKSYFINYNDMIITKIKKNLNNIFDNECIAYFCKYYRERLNLNFEFYYNNDQVVTVLPILDCVKSRQVEEEKLLKNTNIILDKFVKENDTLKKILITPELYVKAYCEDCGNDNFFIYNDEYYLLDLETFYFCIYTPEGHSIGLTGVKEEYENIVKSYNGSKQCEKAIRMDNMLMY